MARLNISLPEDVYALAVKWRRRVNLSEICARALRSELEAAESHRSAQALFSALRSPSTLERTLAVRYKLSEVVVPEITQDTTDVREALGNAAATYLNRYLCDGSLLAIGGGRQMWCVVKNLTPRQVSVRITGLGIRQNDPQVLHAHANTLTTLLWLLYSPRAKAQLVGEALDTVWTSDLPSAPYPKYFVVGSCGPFNATCPLANLLGEEAATHLLKQQVCGDFLYCFFDQDGRLAPAPPLPHQSILPVDLLQRLSLRADARVILVAGGLEKLKIIKFALTVGMCNVLITDPATTQRLFDENVEEV